MLGVAFSLTSPPPFASGGTTLSSLALFNRCYTNLTRMALPKNHPLLAAVSAGTLSPTAACLKVLQGAQLAATGTKTGYVGGTTQPSAEALAVLRTFNDFHRSWFPSDQINLVFPIIEWVPWSDRVHDVSEAALHLTRALLQPGLSYSDVVTIDPVLEALRANGLSSLPPATNTANPPVPISFTQFQSASAGNTPLTVQGYPSGQVPGVQLGTLLGIRPMPLNAVKNGMRAWGQYMAGQASGTLARAFSQGAVNQGYGGGLIGSPSYLLLNMGRADWSTMDGGIRQSRRWAESIFVNLLCRSLPVLRPEDAAPYVETQITATTPPFRQSASCMQCHGGMDPMASSIRNLVFGGTTQNGAGGAGLAMVFSTGAPTLPPETGPVDADPLFYQRPPNGRLIFRSYDGSLVNTPVSGLDSLGQAIASTPDFYVCAAKRYFQFLTGISVNLEDLGDPTSVPLNAADTAYRNEVIQFGLQLEKDQSLQNLLMNILNSPTYQSATLRAYGPGN